MRVRGASHYQGLGVTMHNMLDYRLSDADRAVAQRIRDAIEQNREADGLEIFASIMVQPATLSDWLLASIEG